MPTLEYQIRLSELTDAELVDLTRSGDERAYSELWTRYSRRAYTVARRVTSTFDPHDLVAESYTRILQVIRSGGGPTGSFSGYLYSTIRNVAAKWAQRALPTTDVETLDELPDPFDAGHSTELRIAVGEAFKSLSTRWQEVLWYSEVKGLSSADVGQILGIKATAAAMLASRARQGFRRAWAEIHAD